MSPAFQSFGVGMHPFMTFIIKELTVLKDYADKQKQQAHIPLSIWSPIKIKKAIDAPYM